MELRHQWVRLYSTAITATPITNRTVISLHRCARLTDYRIKVSAFAFTALPFPNQLQSLSSDWALACWFACDVSKEIALTPTLPRGRHEFPESRKRKLPSL